MKSHNNKISFYPEEFINNGKESQYSDFEILISSKIGNMLFQKEILKKEN